MLSDLEECLRSGKGGNSFAAAGMLVVVSSPSGGGKGTLISRALKTLPDIGYSVSFTTRSPRAGEQEGRDYFFVSPEEFQRMINAGDFLEWAVVHGHRYGTAREQVIGELSQGRDIILEIDVQGAASVRSAVSEAIGVFILPPSFEVLRSRLLSRATERPEDLTIRLNNARNEVERFREFDYIVINDDAERASFRLASIIVAERARCPRQESQILQILNTFPRNKK